MKIHSNRIYTADGLKSGVLVVEDGKDADFCVISEDYKALNAYSCGREVYNRENDGVIFNTPYIEKLAKH